MDAFENVVSEILNRDGYWTRNSVKVELTKEEKRRIGKPTCPRWELDIVGYSGGRNELLVVECKSYLDSKGVAYKDFISKDKDRYKLFHDDVLREVILNRLKYQMYDAKLIQAKVKLQLALVCGKFTSRSDEKQLLKHFKNQDWILWGDKWLCEKLQEISNESYENSSVAVVTKLLLRNQFLQL